MVQRVFFGTLFVVVLVTLCMLDALIAAQAVEVPAPLGELLQHGSVVPLAFLVLFVAGAVELNHLFRLRSARPYPAFTCVMVGLLLISPWLSSAGLLGGAGPKVEGLYWQMIWMIVSVAGVGTIPIVRRNPDGALRDGAATLTPSIASQDPITTAFRSWRRSLRPTAANAIPRNTASTSAVGMPCRRGPRCSAPRE